jgi:hypothetical protein
MGAFLAPNFDAKVFSFITLEREREGDAACTRRLEALSRGTINAQHNKVFTRRQRGPCGAGRYLAGILQWFCSDMGNLQGRALIGIVNFAPLFVRCVGLRCSRML